MSGTNENSGYFKLSFKDQIGADGYIRCGFYYNGRYYSNYPGNPWVSNSNTSFIVTLTGGSGEITIPIPKVTGPYTFLDTQIQVVLYDDFDNGKTSALITDISVDYEPPYKPLTDRGSSNKYTKKLSKSREDVNIQLNLASSFGNVKSPSHVYFVNTYWYGQESVDYLEPITSINYNLDGGTTEARRPEVDLLNRMASYYGAARQTLKLIVYSETQKTGGWPKQKLIGFDNKTYLPLAVSREWQQEIDTLSCFEIPS